MSDPILPKGIWIGAALGLDERLFVRVDLALAGHEGDRDGADAADDPNRLALVATPAETRLIGGFLKLQPDRRARVLGALLLRQADLVEAYNRPHFLRLVGGG